MIGLREYRTRVYKLEEGRWRVMYWLPYSGHLYADHETWQEAMDDAEMIEVARVWT